MPPSPTGPDDPLRVLAMVAHELRSPLAGITGMLITAVGGHHRDADHVAAAQQAARPVRA